VRRAAPHLFAKSARLSEIAHLAHSRALRPDATALQPPVTLMEDAKRSWWVRCNGRKWYDRPWLPFRMKAVYFWRQRDRTASAARQLTLEEFPMVARRTWIGILPQDLLEHLHEEYKRKRFMDRRNAMRPGSRLRLRFSTLVTVEALITEKKWHILRNAPEAFWRTVGENGVFVTRRFRASVDSEWRKSGVLCNAARDFGTGAIHSDYLGGTYPMQYLTVWRSLHAFFEEYVRANVYQREDEAEAVPPGLSRILEAGGSQTDRILQAGKVHLSSFLNWPGRPACR